MDLQNFITKYSGQQKGYPTDKDYSGECLSIVKLYIKEVFGIDPPSSGVNSAYGYWTNFPDPLGSIFDKVPYKKGLVPQSGDIPIWSSELSGSKGFGHIDIFVSGDSNSFTGFDQNWGGKTAHPEAHSYNNLLGWLHPKGNNMLGSANYDLFGTPDGAVYERLNNYALVHIPSPDFAVRYYGADWASKVTKVDDIWTVGWVAEDPRPLKAQVNELTLQVSAIQGDMKSLTTDYKVITVELQDEKDALEVSNKVVDSWQIANKKLQDKLDSINKPNVSTGVTQSLWDIIKSWFGK